MTTKKIILAHDSFTQLGGAERVFLEMCDMFPEAPIYTLAANREVLNQLPKEVVKRIHTTPLQYLYRLYPKFQHLLFFIPLALRLAKIPNCDILLSSSSAFAKGFRKPRNSRHINYCHTPTRFLWSDAEYMKQEVPFLLIWPVKIFLWWMKRWDKMIVNNVDIFLANSKEVQKRIKRFYNRDAEVVYPFIDMEKWQTDKTQISDGKYFLIAGRLHAHKHNELVIEACNDLGLQLHVVGEGRDKKNLELIAGKTVTFFGRVSDAELKKEYADASAYIYPQLEDFGLMPLEAASSGTPTIASNAGGALETVVSGVTGEFFAFKDKEDLKRVLLSWDKTRYNVENLREHARKFNKKTFTMQIMEAIK